MPFKTDTATVRTIGIDTGKNTLHMIGLDEKGTIVLREKVARGRIAARLVNVPQCLIGIEAGMATQVGTHSITSSARASSVGRTSSLVKKGRLPRNQVCVQEKPA